MQQLGKKRPKFGEAVGEASAPFSTRREGIDDDVGQANFETSSTGDENGQVHTSLAYCAEALWAHCAIFLPHVGKERQIISLTTVTERLF